MNENNEKNTDFKFDEIKEQKAEELFFDDSHCEEAHVSENEAELTYDESEISQSGEEVSAEENILSVEGKETDGAAATGNANAESNEDFENSSLSEENGFTEETENGMSEATGFTEETENGESKVKGFVEEIENGASETTGFAEETENGESEEKLSDTETVPEPENETPSEIFVGEEDFRISDEEFSRALKNPMFPMFSRGRNESVEQSVRNFCKMIAAGKNSVSEEDRIRMTPYSGYGVVSDIALSERQKKIAREAGMSYREYYEIIKSLPKKSK